MPAVATTTAKNNDAQLLLLAIVAEEENGDGKEEQVLLQQRQGARDDMRGEFLGSVGESQASFQEGKEKSEGRTGSPNGNLTFLLRHEVLVSSTARSGSRAAALHDIGVSREKSRCPTMLREEARSPE
jgi:hypothetical protein